MCNVSINIPNEVLLDLHETKPGFARYARQMLAVDLYKNKKISIGYCAQIAELPEEEFIELLGTFGVSIFAFDDEAEFLEELSNA